MEIDLDPSIDLISINIPFKATVDTEFEITVPFRDPYGQLFQKQGDNLILLDPKFDYSNLVDGTDLKALHAGKISITPINLELVSKSSMAELGQKIKGRW